MTEHNGHPVPPRPVVHPPQYQIPTQPHPQFSETEHQRAGLFRAGKIAVWLWIVLTLIPLFIIAGCIGLCFMGGVLGAVTPTPTATP